MLHSIAPLLARNKYLDVVLVDENAVAGLAGGLAQDPLLDESLDSSGRGREVGIQGGGNALYVENRTLSEATQGAGRLAARSAKLLDLG